MCCRMLIVSLLWLVPTLVASAQAPVKKTSPPARPTPTVADFAYGKDSERQKFDFWQAKSDKPTPVVLLIHGGGWKGGDKRATARTTIQPFLDAGISVAAINYRFILQAMEQKVEPPVKGCLHDAARALQTIRSKAKEWNLDPTRVGATGGSAGACTSLWLALHDDLADPKSSDPVARQSSRLTCAAVSGAQTSLDPKELREWMPNADLRRPRLRLCRGGPQPGRGIRSADRQSRKGPALDQGILADRAGHEPTIRRSISIIRTRRRRPSSARSEPDPTHSAIYGVKLEEKLKSAGVEVRRSRILVTRMRSTARSPSS